MSTPILGVPYTFDHVARQWVTLGRPALPGSIGLYPSDALYPTDDLYPAGD